MYTRVSRLHHGFRVTCGRGTTLGAREQRDGIARVPYVTRATTCAARTAAGTLKALRTNILRNRRPGVSCAANPWRRGRVRPRRRDANVKMAAIADGGSSHGAAVPGHCARCSRHAYTYITLTWPWASCNNNAQDTNKCARASDGNGSGHALVSCALARGRDVGVRTWRWPGLNFVCELVAVAYSIEIIYNI